MANQVLVPPPDIKDRQINAPKLLMEQGPGLFRSLANNVRDVLYPEKFSPLRLTSRPVPVKGIWGAYDNTRQASAVSMTVHAAMIGVLILLSVMGAKVVQETKKNEVTEVIAPDVSVYMPMTTKKLPSMGGGGGGGDRDKIQAPKGKLPTRSMEQLAPPEVVVRNDHPKLEVEPTIVMPANVQIPNPNMPNIGDPRSNIAGPPSNGVGSGGGIGSGSGGGIGSGTGAGHGPGTGGGYGGGVFRVGGGVTAPRAVSTPDPEYSEEARKAKYQGTVVLWLIVDQTGRPQQMKVARSLGMGLDQKALEAVHQWKFEPATKDGKPVAVQINVEVNFRLY